MSGPARDLWIEIQTRPAHTAVHDMSGPARDLWIEIPQINRVRAVIESGPARDLWIEMYEPFSISRYTFVGSRKGPVD